MNARLVDYWHLWVARPVVLAPAEQSVPFFEVADCLRSAPSSPRLNGMGKSSRRRSQPPAQLLASGGSAVSGERAIISASARFIAAAREFAEVVERGNAQLTVVALPQDLDDIARYVASGAADVDLRDLRHAWRVVDEGLPVAGGRAHSEARRAESPRRWRGPLTPQGVLEHAQIAEADDPGYLEQLAANERFHSERDARAQEHLLNPCGRQTASGGSCSTVRVFVPPRGFVDGPACWRHVTSSEEAEIREIYKRAVTEQSCAGCTAKIGDECRIGDGVASELRLVDSEWARVRSFKGLKAHDVRLLSLTSSVN